MSNEALVLLLVVLVASGVVLALTTWRFRRKSAIQQRQLSSLYAVAEDMITATDPSEIYTRIVRTLPPMLDATHCFLFLYNRAEKQLDVLAGTDKFPAPALPLDGNSGPATCFKNKALLEVPEAGSCPFVDADTVMRLGQKSLLFVPMVSEGEIIGLLEIDDRRRTRSFTHEQKASAQHVANLGALAMKLCEQRSMREQLYRTEKMAAVGELISGVAHELKNPLASLMGLSELAMVRHGNGPLADDLRTIHAEARHATSILRRLISFARPQKPGPAAVDINAVLRSAMSVRAEKWESMGIRTQLQLSSTPPMVVSDPSHLEQVFLNLLINAERALEGSREKVITVRTTILSKRVVISISDTGRGASREIQNPAYGLFFDSRRAGETAGLGLALCQSLIEGHGGSIRVSNTPGHSTTFEVEYPLADGARRPPAQAAASRETAARTAVNLTALVIDEDRKVQDSLLSLLSDRKYRVITVASAEEALDLAERARFDLVLCDVRMRGMSGIELYRRLQTRIQSFVFLTGDTFSADMREMFSEPNQAVLAKPFTAADVERLLDEIEPQMTGAHAG
jgi:signal transduction histidine kinase/CheY-like chemotaxis protein